MNHTPKWKVQQLEDAHNSYADWPTFAIRDNTTNVCLALVGAVDHYDSEHNPDRARLIAAAPELLAIVKEFIQDYQALGVGDGETVEKAQRIIAKAEGKEGRP